MEKGQVAPDTWIQGVELAHYVALAMDPHMDRAIRIKQSAQGVDAALGRLSETLDDGSQRSLADVKTNRLDELVGLAIYGAQTSALHAANRAEEEYGLLEKLKELRELNRDLDVIRYSSFEDEPEDLDTKGKIAKIESALEMRDKIADVLKLSGNPKTVDELTDEEVVGLIDFLG